MASACKSDALYNFGPASGRSSTVFGSARPGAKQQRCFNPDDKVSPSEVDEWVSFMREQGIQRVVSLLSASELDTYQQPLDTQLQSSFSAHCVLDPKESGANEKLVQFVEEGVAAGEKVLVHCWGGGGRTGTALARWLAQHYQLNRQEAADDVLATAAACGTSRRVDVDAL